MGPSLEISIKGESALRQNGGVMGRPETMCPCTNFRPGTQNVPGMMHPCHYMRDTVNVGNFDYGI